MLFVYLYCTTVIGSFVYLLGFALLLHDIYEKEFTKEKFKLIKNYRKAKQKSSNNFYLLLFLIPVFNIFLCVICSLNVNVIQEELYNSYLQDLHELEQVGFTDGVC